MDTKTYELAGLFLDPMEKAGGFLGLGLLGHGSRVLKPTAIPEQRLRGQPRVTITTADQPRSEWREGLGQVVTRRNSACGGRLVETGLPAAGTSRGRERRGIVVAGRRHRHVMHRGALGTKGGLENGGRGGWSVSTLPVVIRSEETHLAARVRPLPHPEGADGRRRRNDLLVAVQRRRAVLENPPVLDFARCLDRVVDGFEFLALGNQLRILARITQIERRGPSLCLLLGRAGDSWLSGRLLWRFRWASCAVLDELTQGRHVAFASHRAGLGSPE